MRRLLCCRVKNIKDSCLNIVHGIIKIAKKLGFEVNQQFFFSKNKEIFAVNFHWSFRTGTPRWHSLSKGMSFMMSLQDS
jgi:hypothetical protein